MGAKFKKMRDLIMNLSNIYHRVLQQECVGEVKRKVSGTQENDMSEEVDGINDMRKDDGRVTYEDNGSHNDMMPRKDF